METSRALPRPVPRARVSRLLVATALGLSLSAAPALAAEEPAGDDGVEVTEDGEPVEDGESDDEGEASEKIQLAETPRDRLGLLMLGFLGAITVGGAVTSVRQLKGKRPQASGEFRWR